MPCHTIWIPVSERLPEPAQDVLVVHRDVDEPSGKLRGPEITIGYWDITSWTESFDARALYHVTHWANLPALPPANEQEKA